MNRWCVVGLPVLLLITAAAAEQRPATPDSGRYRTWIVEMKTMERGPFAQLRWFCNDGTVLPPKPYGCGEHGGGYQHGEWSARTRELREHGYRIANILAGLDTQAYLDGAEFPENYNQLLIEKFLIAADNGWILRRAQFYRGAIQEEDERAAARDLLIALCDKPEWIGPRYPALRIGVRLLPHGRESATIQGVRQLAVSLSEQDPGFIKLRGKIHGSPEAGDAGLVREYAAGVKDAGLRTKYQDLAAEIDRLYHVRPLSEQLEDRARVYSRAPWLQRLLRDAAAAIDADDSAASRFHITGRLLAELRESLPRIKQPSARLSVLDLSLMVETENFRAGTELRTRLPLATRQQRITWLLSAVEAAYGTGMINRRGRGELEASLARLDAPTVPLALYQEELNYLGRAPGWATQGLRFQFYAAMQQLGEIEPLAMIFIQDQLRGSPLLFYSQVLDTLLRDANRLVGVRHRLFGEEIGVGFRALNPGLARGVLHADPDLQRLDAFKPDGIYLLPETVSDLPPVAGILTAGEGNPLSHVQLLARNLGIPNVGVDESLLTQIRRHDGESVVLAVSSAGQVELAQDGARWDTVFAEPGVQSDVVIRPDLDKLDLSVRDFVSLEDLRATDSGRIVGPKAAKLGELRAHFPEAVAPGLAIPFGVFREEVLDRPHDGSGQSVFDWMVAGYRALERLPAGSAERRAAAERLRAELYTVIAGTVPDEAFRQRLRAAMSETFGAVDGFGVFIRSDTNVEDLPGFTGAGLNLTLPNVVGFDNIVNGIVQVWASPFSARAFAWRQSRMEQPEHVYPAVLLLRSVPNDKSGVMVTQDIDTGDPGILTVAVNEGVGGAVDGQSAESLRIDTRDGSVRVLAMATAPWRRVPAATGGIEKRPVSGSESVLQPAEVRRLIELAAELPQRFPPITDDAGKPAPADIEFGFLDGKLQLFQLRPFLESRKARGSAYLLGMDSALRVDPERRVNMQEVPG